MKRDWSMDPPHNFSEHTDLGFSLVQMQRPKLSKPSCVPMRGVWSVDLPQNLSGHKDPMFSMDPPEPSCVSMKSDCLMEPPRNFRGHTVPNLGFRLSNCGVTAEGCAVLASALRSNPSRLRELDLSENKLQDSGLNLLSDGLKDPHCKLEKLMLIHCGVADEGCAALASALKSNSSNLRELDLTWNNLQNTSLTLLAVGLKDPHCKLEKLTISYCDITHEGCAALASALRSNLRKLDLTGNNLGEGGLTLLSDGLKDPHCKLEKLRLSDCDITAEGCAALASVLRSNPSHLRELDLTANNLGDRSVKLLSAGLKCPHCKLETLMLWDCAITDTSCAVLASALRSNPSHLRELNLLGNKLGYRGLKLLSVLKDQPLYKLETLLY
uniref:Uncharacterized protein n=1 Tax=Cyprinus carpio TaxID=7962 RepID=A0A8C2I8E5_CYPCA